MNKNKIIQKCQKKIHDAFFMDILPAILMDQEDDHLSINHKKTIAKNPGIRLNPSPAKWATISGKGDSSHKQYLNVNLLDHSLAVGRGATFFSILYAIEDYKDELNSPEITEEEILNIEQNILQAAAIAFVVGLLHDVDKGMKKDGELVSALDIDYYIKLFEIDKFLSRFLISIPSSAILWGINQVEDRATYRSSEKFVIDRKFTRFLEWAGIGARCTDYLEFIITSKEQIEYEAEINKALKNYNIPGLEEWKMICFYEPHHPILSEYLFLSLIESVYNICQIDSIYATQKDGYSIIFIPKNKEEEIIKEAKIDFENRIIRNLDSKIFTSSANTALYNGPNRENGKNLGEFIENHTPQNKEYIKLLSLKKKTYADISVQLINLLNQYNIPLPNIDFIKAKDSGEKYFYLYQKIDIPPKQGTWLNDTLIIAFILSYENNNHPGEKKRESLEKIVGSPPKWIINASDDSSDKKTFLALWTICNIINDSQKYALVFGSDGWVDNILGGENGLLYSAGTFLEEIIKETKNYYSDIIEGKIVGNSNLDPEFACYLTGLPIITEDKKNNKKIPKEGYIIDTSSATFGIKSTAFSYRNGRPENRFTAVPGTFLSPVSLTEFKLKKSLSSQKNIRDDGVPAYLCVPSYSGIFGTVVYNCARMLKKEDSIMNLRFFEASMGVKNKEEALKTIPEIYEKHTTIGRFELVPTSFADQIQYLYTILRVVRRTGRPVHLFQGAPIPQKAIFYWDACPKILQEIIGGNSLRLDEIPNAIEKLKACYDLSQLNNVNISILKKLFSNGKWNILTLALIVEKLKDEKTSIRFFENKLNNLIKGVSK